MPVSSVSFLTGADIRVVSVSTVGIYVTYIASSAALFEAWVHSNVEKGSLLEEQLKSVKTFILTLTLGGNMTSFWPDCCPKNL